jgi:hypothetical protein
MGALMEHLDSGLIDDLRDLEKQATTERSHYYVATCCRRAIAELERKGAQIERLQAEIKTVVSVIGGTIEGHPTSSINYLQRLRELLRIECASHAPPRRAGPFYGDPQEPPDVP